MFVKFEGNAANIHIGQLLGANQPDHAKNATRVAYTISSTKIYFFKLN